MNLPARSPRRRRLGAPLALGLLGGLALLLRALPLSVPPAPPPRPPEVVVRVVTFNLLHGGIFSERLGDDASLEARLRIVADRLRALDPDVVALQEASVGPRRGDVARRLAEALGYHHAYAPAVTRPFGSRRVQRAVASALGFTEGPALLSRYPLARWAGYELPRCGRPFDVRVLLYAEVATPAGPLPVYSAHISGDPCQARSVADLVAARPGPLPAIVMGDFNAEETSPAIQLLPGPAGFRDTFRLANPGASGFTEGQAVRARGRTAGQRIDYVFLRPGGRGPGRVVASRVVLDAPGPGSVLWPSDHYGVLAEIGVGPPAATGRRTAARSPEGR